MANPNIELLVRVTEALGELREQMVFVGGCATALLISDRAAAKARVTEDVDAIVAIVSLAEYHSLGSALRARGFSQTLEEGEPPYRWTIAGMKLDVMPMNATVLGFSNKWYETAMQTASVVAIGEGLSIRLVTPPFYWYEARGVPRSRQRRLSGESRSGRCDIGCGWTSRACRGDRADSRKPSGLHRERLRAISR